MVYCCFCQRTSISNFHDWSQHLCSLFNVSRACSRTPEISGDLWNLLYYLTDHLPRVPNDDPLTTPNVNSMPPVSIPTIQPPIRSMSMEQREAFLSVLNNQSNASIYAVPRDDIYDIQASAVKVGFYVHCLREGYLRPSRPSNPRTE
ncbi:hypothetical protein H2248_006769 [Termitomyces sp. 'cryptogamus']|nr:hypothetical protein H2248_006769 [Termitomyces sp. 'cryptogamus']